MIWVKMIRVRVNLTIHELTHPSLQRRQPVEAEPGPPRMSGLQRWRKKPKKKTGRHTPLAYNEQAVIIIETAIFTQRITELMSDDDYRSLQEALVNRPDMGSVIRGTGGIRKVRWRLEGRGKSGGTRVIYYWVTADEQIYMLYAYPKNEQEDLTEAQKKLLKQVVESWLNE